MSLQILDHTMFDDGSFECFNFWLADQDGCNQVDHTHPVIVECRKQIELAMSQGKSHYSTNGLISYGGLTVLEIQWG